MSKLSEYSKFDSLDTDDSDDDERDEPVASRAQQPQPPSAASTQDAQEATRVDPDASTASATCCLTPHPDVTGRFRFQYEQRTIYEWEQSLTEVVLYVPAPAQLLQTAGSIECHITSSRLQLGQRGRRPFLIDEETFDTIDTTESTWCIEDDMVVVYLHKAHKGSVWEAALKGNPALNSSSVTLDPAQREHVQKQLLKERWNEENPGFDFSEASFNGSNVPDPRTFMGGVSYK